MKLALQRSPTLGWLAAHDKPSRADQPATLAWVIKAGAALGSNAGGLASPHRHCRPPVEALDE